MHVYRTIQAWEFAVHHPRRHDLMLVLIDIHAGKYAIISMLCMPLLDCY
jgi:hypothetical protein